jgi:hypothetical protein
MPSYESTQGTLFGNNQDYVPTDKTTISMVPHNYFLIENEKELSEFVTRAMGLKEICFDTETSINPLDSELAIALREKDRDIWCISGVAGNCQGET